MSRGFGVCVCVCVCVCVTDQVTLPYRYTYNSKGELTDEAQPASILQTVEEHIRVSYPVGQPLASWGGEGEGTRGEG